MTTSSYMHVSHFIAVLPSSLPAAPPTLSAGYRSVTTKERGAVDLFGQPGLHVMDGSVMLANPGAAVRAHVQ